MALPLSNLLLEALPADYKSGFMAKLEAISLPVNTVLFEPEETPRYVHFITSGIASIVTPMAGGDGVEVGLVGHGGLPECVHLLGPQTGSARCFMQIGGSGLRMEYKQFQQEFLHHPALHSLVLQYVQYEILVLAQIAACNRLHEVEERLARWLLMVQDKIGDSTIHLTQEFLADMLGSRRSTVTIAAGILQRSGLIEYSRGRIKILDTEKMISAACECYPLVRNLYLNLYKVSAPPQSILKSYPVHAAS